MTDRFDLQTYTHTCMEGKCHLGGGGRSSQGRIWRWWWQAKANVGFGVIQLREGRGGQGRTLVFCVCVCVCGVCQLANVRIWLNAREREREREGQGREKGEENEGWAHPARLTFFPFIPLVFQSTKFLSSSFDRRRR